MQPAAWRNSVALSIVAARLGLTRCGGTPPHSLALQLKGDLNAVRKNIQKANDAASRTDLMSGKQSQQKAETEARDRMVAATESAVRGTGKLQQAQNLLAESQDIGISVIDTMQQQRESLLRSTDKVSAPNGLY